MSERLFSKEYSGQNAASFLTSSSREPGLLSDSSSRSFLALMSRILSNSHAMRNELVEELIVDREAKIMQDRTGSSVETAKPASGRANQAAERKK